MGSQNILKFMKYGIPSMHLERKKGKFRRGRQQHLNQQNEDDIKCITQSWNCKRSEPQKYENSANYSTRQSRNLPSSNETGWMTLSHTHTQREQVKKGSDKRIILLLTKSKQKTQLTHPLPFTDTSSKEPNFIERKPGTKTR